MKKSIFLLCVVWITTINAQGITNTLGGGSDSDRFIIENSTGGKILTATGHGNVGISVVNPVFKLDVGGTSNMQGFRLPTGANSGYVLTSDGSGIGTWQQLPTASADNDWTISGNDLIMAQGGSVVIGRDDPIDSKVMVETETRIVGVRSHVFNNSARAIWGTGWGDYATGVTGEGIGNNGSGVTGIGTKYGVKGEATASSGLHYGGFFETDNPSGRGIYATSSTSTGSAYGGVFEATQSSDGIGVYAAGKAYDFYAAGAGTNYGASSSKRWKKNIIEIDNPLEKLAKLRGVYFDWDEEHGGGHDVGCIAEEVGKVLPEIVVYEENGIDADGMDYSKLTPLLVEAIKALQKRVEELENK